jgi:hypothetical protein
MLSYLPIILMVVATTCYHIEQKSVPTRVNPFSSLILNYTTALAGTLVLMSGLAKTSHTCKMNDLAQSSIRTFPI